MSKQPARAGGLDPKKVSGELFVLTYGAMVSQLIKDYEEDEDVNSQLDKMGYNIGLRLIDDFLAKNPNVGKCNDFREVAEVIAKVHMEVSCWFVQDQLRGDPSTEIRIKFIRKLEESIPMGEED